MKNKFSFQVTQNKLYGNSISHPLYVSNDYYDIIIFYTGDYPEDKEKNAINPSNITCTCKCKGNTLALTCMGGEVRIEEDGRPYFSIEDVAALKKSLTIAEQSAIELQAIMKEYYQQST